MMLITVLVYFGEAPDDVIDLGILNIQIEGLLNNNISSDIEISTPQQPKLIIVASINAGTSTLNRILMHNFKYFFHSFRDLEDMYYWIGCTPKEYTKYIENHRNRRSRSIKSIFTDILMFKHLQYKSWNANFDNLISRGCKSNNKKSYHCNIKCNHDDYMQHIGVNITSKYDYIYSNESNSIYNESIYYYWDRTSGYNSLPYIPVILSTNYQYSKLLYIIREPIQQAYSRFRLFDEHTFLMKANELKHNLTSTEANRRYGNLLSFIHSDLYSPMISLLINTENDSYIRNTHDIISWYIAIWAKKGISWKDQRIFDFCPFINILLFVESSLYFNKLFGINNFKFIQFEWETQNLLLSSLYIYCWTVNNQSEFNNDCILKYTQNNSKNINNIMYNSEELQLNHYGKLKKYKWSFTNLTIFDQLIEFINICDKRLIELTEIYTSIILGEFNIELWETHREEIRQQMMENNRITTDENEQTIQSLENDTISPLLTTSRFL